MQLQRDMSVAVDIPPPVAETQAPRDLEEENLPESCTSPPLNVPAIDFKLLEAKNSDTVGWVYIEDTNINYPVVQGTDNRHYVTTLFDGSVNQAGSIFMDFRNNPELCDRHTILYGHNMRNKTMFADILNYQSQEFYDAHPVGIYMTKDKTYSFELVAAYVASTADSAWQLEFVTDKDADTWLQEAISRTPFRSRAVPQIGDRYITLSTCSYEFSDARFVLIGILQEI